MNIIKKLAVIVISIIIVFCGVFFVFFLGRDLFYYVYKIILLG